MTVEFAEIKIADQANRDGYRMIPDVDLRRLSELMGVESEYVDGRGVLHQATDDTLRAILRGLGLKISSESDIRGEWGRIQEERWTHIVEPVLLHYPEAKTPLSFSIALPIGDVALEAMAIECQLKDEQGKFDHQR